MTDISAIFVGYDPREDAAYEVCRYSLQKRMSTEIPIYPLKMRELRVKGLYERPYSVEPHGQMVDGEDGRPFSTEFSFTRFLTPHVAKERNINGLVLFVDCDFLFLADINELGKLNLDEYPLSCVKHQWEKVSEGIKMDGQIQQRYNRKLWSSLMVFNMDHFYWNQDNHLSPQDVNFKEGTWLHSFQWLGDWPIGSIPGEWNYIPGFSPTCWQPKGIHYSMEAPWFNEMMPWVDEYAEMVAR